MENQKTYNIKEAAKILGIGTVTVRRRIKDKTLEAKYVSKRDGYQIPADALDKFAAERKSKNTAKSKADMGSAKLKNKPGRKPAAKAAKSSVQTTSESVATPVVKSNVKNNTVETADTTTEMLVGGSLGIALSAIVGAYSSIGELHLPENNVKKLIKELQSPLVIDKVIDRLKAEQEYFDIQVSAQELKVQQTTKKDQKATEQDKLINLRLKKNQIGKDIRDLELRKALLG